MRYIPRLWLHLRLLWDTATGTPLQDTRNPGTYVPTSTTTKAKGVATP